MSRLISCREKNRNIKYMYGMIAIALCAAGLGVLIVYRIWRRPVDAPVARGRFISFVTAPLIGALAFLVWSWKRLRRARGGKPNPHVSAIAQGILQRWQTVGIPPQVIQSRTKTNWHHALAAMRAHSFISGVAIGWFFQGMFPGRTGNAFRADNFKKGLMWDYWYFQRQVSLMFVPRSFKVSPGLITSGFYYTAMQLEMIDPGSGTVQIFSADVTCLDYPAWDTMQLTGFECTRPMNMKHIWFYNLVVDGQKYSIDFDRDISIDILAQGAKTAIRPDDKLYDFKNALVQRASGSGTFQPVVVRGGLRSIQCIKPPQGSNVGTLQVEYVLGSSQGIFTAQINPKGFDAQVIRANLPYATQADVDLDMSILTDNFWHETVIGRGLLAYGATQDWLVSSTSAEVDALKVAKPVFAKYVGVFGRLMRQGVAPGSDLGLILMGFSAAAGMVVTSPPATLKPQAFYKLPVDLAWSEQKRKQSFAAVVGMLLKIAYHRRINPYRSDQDAYSFVLWRLGKACGFDVAWGFTQWPTNKDDLSAWRVHAKALKSPDGTPYICPFAEFSRAASDIMLALPPMQAEDGTFWKTCIPENDLYTPGATVQLQSMSGGQQPYPSFNVFFHDDSSKSFPGVRPPMLSLPTIRDWPEDDLGIQSRGSLKMKVRGMLKDMESFNAFQRDVENWNWSQIASEAVARPRQRDRLEQPPILNALSLVPLREDATDQGYFLPQRYMPLEVTGTSVKFPGLSPVPLPQDDTQRFGRLLMEDGDDAAPAISEGLLFNYVWMIAATVVYVINPRRRRIAQENMFANMVQEGIAMGSPAELVPVVEGQLQHGPALANLFLDVTPAGVQARVRPAPQHPVGVALAQAIGAVIAETQTDDREL